MAPHSSTLAWRIPWMEEPGGQQSMESRRVGHDWATSLSLFTFMHLEKKMATHSSVLAWRIPGTGEPGGLHSMRSHRVRHDWSDLAAAAAAAVNDFKGTKEDKNQQLLVDQGNNYTGSNKSVVRVKITLKYILELFCRIQAPLSTPPPD